MPRGKGAPKKLEKVYKKKSKELVKINNRKNIKTGKEPSINDKRKSILNQCNNETFDVSRYREPRCSDSQSSSSSSETETSETDSYTTSYDSESGTDGCNCTCHDSSGSSTCSCSDCWESSGSDDCFCSDCETD